MALSFDDKILGEKVNNYCSSSEDEADEFLEARSYNPDSSRCTIATKSTNTGPKSVIEDYNTFKKLQLANQIEKEIQLVETVKKCSLTCRPHSVDVLMDKEDEEFEAFLEELNQDSSFMELYRQKRINELKTAFLNLPNYSKIFILNNTNFVKEIDEEPPLVCIIVHLYEENVQSCTNANFALEELCVVYTHIKFCKMKASENMSTNFCLNGVPAILVYKNKELIGNLISISKYLGDDFTTDEFEMYLHEHGFLPPREIRS